MGESTEIYEGSGGESCGSEKGDEEKGGEGEGVGRGFLPYCRRTAIPVCAILASCCLKTVTYRALLVEQSWQGMTHVVRTIHEQIERYRCDAMGTAKLRLLDGACLYSRSENTVSAVAGETF